VDDREALERAWLALVLARGVGSRTLARIARAAAEAGHAIPALPGAESAWLRATFGLSPSVAAAVQAASAEAAPVRALEGALAERGIGLVALHDAEYPARLREALGAAAPPLLYLEGDASLLRAPSVAIAASRRPAPEAREAARSWVRRLREGGRVVVRGESTPLDRAVAAETPGADIAVLSTGILAKAGRGAPAPARGLRLGFVHPHWGFKGSVERERNAVQAALADLLVVLEARPGGVVEQTARRALAWGRPVLVREARGGPRAEAARRLLEAGARLLSGEAVAAVTGRAAP
jgi:DNA processing protein